MIKRILLGSLLAFALAAGCSAANEPHPPIVRNLMGPDIKVIATFQAPGNMTAYVVSIQGEHHILYVTSDHKHAIIGTMLDEHGRNLTRTQLEKYAPKPDYSQLWQAAEHTDWIAEGAKSPKTVVYVMADPHCPYCHAFWLASQPYEKVGLQVRWIWVAYLRQDSAAKAAAILGAKDPVAAMNRHEKTFTEGGIAPLKHPDPKILDKIKANTALMEQYDIQGTPAIIYKDRDGKAQLIVGMPGLKDLPEIFHLPAQAVDDPALKRLR
ncbi:MAG TPA: thiol:disulfide interchange protein DsbG [Gammaproteobacteria bacterium]|nr:thiol:disulfide interchange protein DsbG [Gammaproteobacteria bacterium]